MNNYVAPGNSMPHTAKDTPPVKFVVQSGQVMPTDTWGRVMAYAGKETVPESAGAFVYVSQAEHDRITSQAYETGYKHGLSAGESAAGLKAEQSQSEKVKVNQPELSLSAADKQARAKSAAELLAKVHAAEHRVGEAQPAGR
jgi:hypothetical protein